MKVLCLEWKSLCDEDIFVVLEEMGHSVVRLNFEGIKEKKECLFDKIKKINLEEGFDFVFSFNYFPVVSVCCNELGVKYVSWVYDSPYIHVYSYTVPFSCNYIFLFDYAVYEELSSGGIQTVYYLPLAVNEKRIKKLIQQKKRYNNYSADISFVGSLYSEQKHDLYRRFVGMNEYTKGYLDGLIKAQQFVQGYYFLQDRLSDDVVNELERVYPSDPNTTTALSPKAIYADYVLARQVTANDRKDILEMLGKKINVNLYTHDKKVQISGVKNFGPVDYYNEMPYVFMNSKINLNITLRSIKTGIPLRVFDIMGCGGFLITNYQAELFQFFSPDEEFVYYENYEDLLDKTTYYLAHDSQREKIAYNGYENIITNHTFEKRIREILEIIK